jgi:DNA-binding transcriptional LysR family regulator
VKRLAILKIAGTPVMRQWHLVHRAEKRLLPAAEAFREFMRSEAARLIAAQVGL